MALHPDLPRSPYELLRPEHRWFPADEALRESSYEKLLPPLVARIREEVFDWRAEGYAGASPTSRALLRWWFEREHLVAGADGLERPFRYYFAQREAVETVVWLHDVRGVRDKFDLLRFDASRRVATGDFIEEWPRYVVKMATGSGKTKVLSLLLAWSYFHRLYEPDSPLARNFLVITPNIIVLDRLRQDFDGLRIFFRDPVLPDPGHEGRGWRDDFQLTLHLQDDARVLRETGNLFLTNIHRVFLGNVSEPSLEDDDLRDYFLQPFGPKPVGKTTDSRTDLGEIVRELDELAIFNDEAHHIHDEKLAWFRSIRDIHYRMLQRDQRLSLQLDLTATPKHDNGAIFVQTVSDYPLVEAIHQNVVKHPVLPDEASRSKLVEQKSAIFSEKYADYLALGVEEWRKSYAEHERLGKKAVLFVMVDDTKNCDEVGEHLQKIAPELEGAVLVIHTKNNGEISEASSGKSVEELEKLRKASNEIDGWGSPYKAIVSVLVLKEGWDVRNVTTIVGLRAYVSKSNILPEQTLGRGLRRMYFGSDIGETVSVLGTPAFMEFVESIESEGVTLERVAMGAGASRADSLIVEIDPAKAGDEQAIEALDIPLPKLSRRFHREFKNLDAIDPAALGNPRLLLKPFTEAETREIVFKTLLDDEIDHTIQLDGAGPADFRSVVAFFARQLLKELRLVSTFDRATGTGARLGTGYDVLYGKVKTFLRDHLFEGSPVDLEDPVVLRNLSEPEPGKILFDAFKAAINALTVEERGSVRVEDWIRLRHVRPFRTDPRGYLAPKRSLFTKIVGEPHAGGFELEFAGWLDTVPGVAAFAKNYLAVGFRLDYVKANGDLADYVPDFLVKADDGTVYVIETKGREELELPGKMARLRQWCADATEASTAAGGPAFRFVYVDQKSFEAHRPTSFPGLVETFLEYQT